MCDFLIREDTKDAHFWQDSVRKMTREAGLCEKHLLEGLAERSSHCFTLQTDLRAFRVPLEKRREMLWEVRQGLRYFLPRLNRKIIRRGWRKDQWQRSERIPLFMVVIEGAYNWAKPNATVHVHGTLGNLHPDFQDLDFQSIFTENWVKTFHGTDDVQVTYMPEGERKPWGKYIAKERVLRRGSVLELDCLQVPGKLKDFLN